jgi:Lipocalin-like domain
MTRILWRLLAPTLVCVLVAPLVGVAASGGSGERARERKVERRLVGTWRLVSAVAKDAGGRTVASPYGPRPVGKLIYTRDREMWALTARRGTPRNAPGNAWYTGRFEVDLRNRRVVHHVQYAGIDGMEGTDQLRYYRLRGRRLRLATAPAGQARVVLRWRKVR